VTRPRTLLSAGIVSSLLLAACGGSTPEPAPAISFFGATPPSVVLGNPSTLAWSVSGATSLAIDQGVGVVTGTSLVVTPGATTTYTLTATGHGGSATGTATVTVTAPPAISFFAATPASVVLGNPSTLAWSVSGATSLAIDQGVGVVTGTSLLVTPGVDTTYRLTATGRGGSATGTATVTVTAPQTVLEEACSGASCAASSPWLYSGAGVGIWRFRNTGAAARTVDLHVGGVTAGKQALLVFSNPMPLPATLPSAGSLASPAALDLAALRMDEASDLDPSEVARQAWHGALLEENRRAGLLLRTATARRDPGASLASLAAPVRPTPTVGESRTWIESVATPTPYATVARAVCDLPSGRKAVLWVDPNATASGSLTTEDLVYFRTTFCGAGGAEADGGFGRVTALMGDVWGTVAPSDAANLISDSPTLQDVNVIFLEVPGALADKIWAGYFWGGNNFRKMVDPSVASSNEALAFFIDATQVHAFATSRSYLGSALLHELTHMVNFYQRDVSRRTPNDTWLEETTATMMDDIVSPVATPDHFSIIPGQRIRPYVASGGGITLLSWDYPAQYTYSLAGAFGAFVNRRYGTSIVTGTIDCLGGGVDCLDGLIRAAGGTGFADEFERVGASIFGLLPLGGTPGGYGYPQKVSGAYTLAPIDVAAYASSRKATAAALGMDFGPGSHTYQLDTVASGRTVYTRTGVVVPAGTSIMLVIQ
jgi:hypothetical protein